jgi:hypothetical protein
MVESLVTQVRLLFQVSCYNQTTQVNVKLNLRVEIVSKLKVNFLNLVFTLPSHDCSQGLFLYVYYVC